jgi:hypothetical protein
MVFVGQDTKKKRKERRFGFDGEKVFCSGEGEFGQTP